MGAEALCRGAAVAVGIEKAGAACQVVTDNWRKVAKPEQTFRVMKGDVVRQLAHLRADKITEGEQVGQQFDCMYFDPPYASELYGPVIDGIVELLAPNAQIAVEYSPTYWQPTQLPEALEVVKEKRYGSTHLVFLARQY